jgi:alkylation response protein AidB-like acyl-CoA dehydrogenase
MTMVLELSREQEMLVSEWRRIANEEFAEEAFSWEGEIPWKNLELLAESGHLGVDIPEKYGGGGLSEFETMLQIETIGQICPDTAAAVRTLSMVGPRFLVMFGSDHAKEKYLRQLANGEVWIAIAISEPDAGSDVGNMSTTIEEFDGGELYLNGEKSWVSHFPSADAAIVWARFPDEGIGCVLMETDQEGIDIIKNHTNMRGETQTHFFMEDVHIPSENVLVRGRKAFYDVMEAMNWDRASQAPLSAAWARCAYDHALEFSQDREQFGQSISEFQGIKWRLAEMSMKVEASRILAYRPYVAARTHGRSPTRLEASLSSHFASSTAQKIIDDALQIFGARGYQKGHELEYLYRLIRGNRIGGGTDAMQKKNIAEGVLNGGLPRLGADDIADT